MTVRPFRAEDLDRLLAPAAAPCISIYMPTNRRFPEWKQDPVRYRQLLSKAESLILPRAGKRQARDPLDPLRELLDGPHWETMLDGLAVFGSPEHHASFRLPIPVKETVIVAESFYVTPLVRALASNQRYYVLAISENAVTLYEGSSYGAGEVELRGVSRSLRDALGVKEPGIYLSRHGGGAAGHILHGIGTGREDSKDELVKFFRRIDRGLREFLRSERTPLILAAVDYYHPLYREANTYPHLLPDRMTGNYDRAPSQTIHAEAWPIVSRSFQEQVAMWVERYRESAGTGLAADSIEEIGLAAVAGRIRCLLAADGETVWGEYDRTNGIVTLHDRRREAADSEVIDDIGEEAIKRGAEVFVIPRAQMPTQSPIAAVFRF